MVQISKLMDLCHSREVPWGVWDHTKKEQASLSSNPVIPLTKLGDPGQVIDLSGRRLNCEIRVLKEDK